MVDSFLLLVLLNKIQQQNENLKSGLNAFCIATKITNIQQRLIGFPSDTLVPFLHISTALHTSHQKPLQFHTTRIRCHQQESLLWISIAIVYWADVWFAAWIDVTRVKWRGRGGGKCYLIQPHYTLHITSSHTSLLSQDLAERFV